MDTTINLQRLRVMIVEDNAHMMLILKTILRGFGVKEFTDARNEQDAWDRLGIEPVDIILVDRMLTKGDGLSLVRRIRTARDSPCPYAPIVMLSAHTERARVAEARDAGINEFCCKPITAKDLYAKIAAVIDRPRPFVRTKSFFGPDRRRREDPGYNGGERREAAG